MRPSELTCGPARLEVSVKKGMLKRSPVQYGVDGAHAEKSAQQAQFA